VLVLAQCYLAVGQTARARKILEDLLQEKEERVSSAQKELAKWMGRHRDKKPEDLSEAEQKKLLRLKVEANPNPFAAEQLMARIRLAEGDEAGALEHLKRAERADVDSPSLLLNMGEIHLRMKQWEEAESYFKKVLRLDPENADAHLGRCRSLLPRRLNLFASDAALKAIALRYANPSAHYLLGLALHRMGRITQAVQALQLAVSQDPNFQDAYERLAYIYEHRLDDPDRAEAYLQKAKEAAQRLVDIREGRVGPIQLTKAAYSASTSDQTLQEPEPLGGAAGYTDQDPETVTIVSGLPRSGTSLMMQMLKAGGVPLLYDNKRPADSDNPMGYFEYEKARQLQKDNAWLHEAKGKAVKIVPQLLASLPEAFPYRIVFAERELDEVMRSQQKMLARRGEPGGNLSVERLKDVFRKQIETVKKMLADRNIPILFVRYADCIQDPAGVAKIINNFFGKTLRENAMAEAVIPGLYRQRAEGSPVSHDLS
jgi:tetratricopeptide (TPR) repeat protein